MRKIFNFS